MNNKINLLIILFTYGYTSISAQTVNSVQTVPAGGFFSFSFPGAPMRSMESNHLKTYEYIDDSVALYCGFADYDSSFYTILKAHLLEDSLPVLPATDSMANPIFGFTEFLKYHFDSLITFNYLDLSISDTSITGREFNLIYAARDVPQPELQSVRMYYNGSDIVCFTVIAPYSKMNKFTLLKNELYNSITIN